ncbi:MAG: SPOR domain-containing protein [Spirochaetaceae bacterium]|jgi:hypothetical protein|nr:SPOR domain-containing protein [Spirochaetaceae bacterium]
MVLIRKSRFRNGLFWNRPAVLALFMLAGLFPFNLHAQASGTALLSDEIPLLERRIASPGLPFAELHDSLVRLGKLFLLSGNPEGAAGAFYRAAFANPENRDDRSLLEAVRCYIALGETERAESGVQMVLVSGRDPAQLREARFLGGLSYAFKTGNIQLLASLLGAPGEGGADYPERKSTVLYALWKITGDESYRARLRAEFPLSPEAESFEETPGRQIAGSSSAMWFLFPGRGAVSLGPPAAREAAPSADLPQAGASAPQPASENAAPAGTVTLQTGLFSREENARTMAGRLEKAGFVPAVSRRTVNGAAYFAVGVNAGSDINAMILRLKDSGFEAFPLY